MGKPRISAPPAGRDQRHLWTLVIVFSIAVVGTLGTLALHVHERPPKPLRPSLLPAPPSEIPLHEFDSPFSSAVDRLNHAFKNHPAMEVEDMISKVNSRTPPGGDQPCPLAWRDNEATLSVHADRLSNLSPTHAIVTCAEAIERLP